MIDCLSRDLRAAPSVTLADRDADYLLSVVLLPTTSGSYVASVAAMRLYTDTALENLSRSWTASEEVRRSVRAAFRGTGALVDQRVLTGESLDGLCHDIARAFDAETLAPARKSLGARGIP
jgi:hypothetical protein